MTTALPGKMRSPAATLDVAWLAALARARAAFAAHAVSPAATTLQAAAVIETLRQLGGTGGRWMTPEAAGHALGRLYRGTATAKLAPDGKIVLLPCEFSPSRPYPRPVFRALYEGARP